MSPESLHLAVVVRHGPLVDGQLVQVRRGLADGGRVFGRNGAFVLLSDVHQAYDHGADDEKEDGCHDGENDQQGGAVRRSRQGGFGGVWGRRRGSADDADA